MAASTMLAVMCHSLPIKMANGQTMMSSVDTRLDFYHTITVATIFNVMPC